MHRKEDQIIEGIRLEIKNGIENEVIRDFLFELFDIIIKASSKWKFSNSIQLAFLQRLKDIGNYFIKLHDDIYQKVYEHCKNQNKELSHHDLLVFFLNEYNDNYNFKSNLIKELEMVNFFVYEECLKATGLEEKPKPHYVEEKNKEGEYNG